MEWRGPVVLMALVAIGAGIGYAASAEDSSVGSGVADPVSAEGPSLRSTRPARRPWTRPTRRCSPGSR